jgi:NAD(P)-dependent dehydrogenase (short-subunit alcohol dehydrogenase family)
VVPGGIDTELWRSWVQRTAADQGRTFDEQRVDRLSGVALQGLSAPEDVADLAGFLASDESRTITGQPIPVDAGGYLLG